MSISEGLLTSAWVSIIYLVYAAICGWAICSAPWGRLAENRRLQHLLFGATLFIAAIWCLRAGISPGLSIHFLGMTVMYLVFGWDFAIIAASVALLGVTAIGKESWDGFAISGFCSVVVPIMVSHVFFTYMDTKLPKNFFVYLFVCAFIGGGVSGAAAGLTGCSFLWLDGVYSWDKIHLEYIQYLPLIMFPEGLLNGMIMTGMMVFCPDWIRSFDAKVYIDDQ